MRGLVAIRIPRFRSKLAKIGATSIPGCLFSLNVEEKLTLQGGNSNLVVRDGGLVKPLRASVEIKEREDKDEDLRRKKRSALYRELTSGENTRYLPQYLEQTLIISLIFQLRAGSTYK